MKLFNKKNHEGFTLVEILIVVVIIGILATIAIPAYFSYVEKGYASDAKVQIKNVAQAAEIYYQENQEWAEIEIMREEGFLDLKTSTLNKWEFETSWPEIDNGILTGGQIIATSTSEMAGGEGHSITFDWELGKYTGYGQKEDNN